MEPTNKNTVAVLGAGPVGLAAAAHLLAYGIRPLVFEAGDGVAASFRDFGHVALFSPWRYNVDRAARQMLEARGWTMPDEEAIPTAGELVHRYLEPLARVPAIADSLKLNTRVISVARQGFDKVKTAGRERAPFVVRVNEQGLLREYLADAVIDATGNWSHPNPLGANGLSAIGEEACRHRIRYGMPDIRSQRARYLGKTTLVVGGGHSAVGSLVALAELAEQDPRTVIHWALRGNSLSRAFGGGEADQLPARGQLGIQLRRLVDEGRLLVHLNFRIHEVRETDGVMAVFPDPFSGDRAPITHVDEIIGATGSRPDLDMVRELRVSTDPLLESAQALAPLIDPNEHSCGTVRPHGHRELAHPEPDFYIVGAKSYGRAPTFLLATGYEQVRSVAAALAGDEIAADDVRLELPETGVCVSGSPGGGACCGIEGKSPNASAPQEKDACGCGSERPSTTACCA